jgi:hypothetical protein
MRGAITILLRKRVRGIEPLSLAWKASLLSLARKAFRFRNKFLPQTYPNNSDFLDSVNHLGCLLGGNV